MTPELAEVLRALVNQRNKLERFKVNFHPHMIGVCGWSKVVPRPMTTDHGITNFEI